MYSIGQGANIPSRMTTSFRRRHRIVHRLGSAASGWPRRSAGLFGGALQLMSKGKRSPEPERNVAARCTFVECPIMASPDIDTRTVRSHRRGLRACRRVATLLPAWRFTSVRCRRWQRLSIRVAYLAGGCIGAVVEWAQRQGFGFPGIEPGDILLHRQDLGVWKCVFVGWVGMDNGGEARNRGHARP